jgi:hypothetical protein
LSPELSTSLPLLKSLSSSIIRLCDLLSIFPNCRTKDNTQPQLHS